MGQGCSALQKSFTLAWGILSLGSWLAPALLAQSSSAQETAGDAVAIVAGKKISAEELTSKIAPQLQQLRNQEFEVKSQALEGLIDQRLLDAEAARREISVGELLRLEVDSKTPPPSDAEVEAFYQGQKDRINQPLEQVKDQLQQMLLQSRAQQVRQGFLKTLRDQADVSVLLAPPRIEVDMNPNRLRGDASAPVTIVEFSDFQCPYCQRAYPTVQAVLSKYAKQVKFSYRDFPLRGLHPQAQMAAQAGRCARLRPPNNNRRCSAESATKDPGDPETIRYSDPKARDARPRLPFRRLTRDARLSSRRNFDTYPCR